MLTRRWILNGLIAAPAVIVAERLMPVHSPRPLRLLTVNDVTWCKNTLDMGLLQGLGGQFRTADGGYLRHAVCFGYGEEVTPQLLAVGQEAIVKALNELRVVRFRL